MMIIKIIVIVAFYALRGTRYTTSQITDTFQNIKRHDVHNDQEKKKEQSQ